MSNAKTQILIVDDHPMMRQGLASLIENEPDLEVCGEAGDAAEALRLVEQCKPNLVLTDITLPDKNGIELLKDILALHPACSAIVISMHDESLYAERVLRAGGRGYIMKQEGGKKIMEGIRKVLGGQIAVSDKMSAKILEIFSGRRPDSNNGLVENLTDREFEVFQLIGKGMDSKQIASQLHLSPKTIDVHRSNIKAKLKITSMTELIRYAVRWVESEVRNER